MGDVHTCSMDGVSTILIKMLGGMVRELKDMRYVPQIVKNFILVGALDAHGLEFISRDGVLKILKGSMVVLKGVRCNNLYYLKGNTVIRQLATSVGTNEESSKLWHMMLEHTGEKSLQDLAK